MKLYQTVILVDEKDEVLGYENKDECHIGQGKHHRAFVTLLFDPQNKVLLQRRKHRFFNNFWDLTAISHPLRINGKDESYQQASDRALEKEMGISHVDVNEVGAFNYFAKDGKNCEREYCAILAGQYSGKFTTNPTEVYEARWIKFEDFVSEISKNPKKYTPWAKEAVNILVNSSSRVIGDKSNLFKEELQKFVGDFSKYSRDFFAKKQRLVKKYPALISRFYRELEEFGKDGKAMRPFLVWLGYRVGNGKGKEASMVRGATILPVCMAVELIHNFLLIHDDIIDNSATRRGKPTIHKRFEKYFGKHYGISQAMLLGDIACLEAFALIANSEFNEKVGSILEKKLLNTVLETVYGEILDVEYSYFRPSLSRILYMTELKTAKYSFVGPLILGAMITGVNKNQTEAILNYGTYLGCAYQIKDDILGIFSDEKTIGKSIAMDMRKGKNTLLFYKTRELAEGEDLKDLERIWGNSKAGLKDLKRICDIITDTGAKKWCDDEMLRLIKLAKKSIKRVTNDAKLQNIFLQLADFVIERES